MISYTTQKNEYPLTPEGEYPAIISEVGIYNNPNGQDKLTVKFAYTDPETGDTATHNEFVIPQIMEGDGFRVFSDLISLVSDEVAAEGDFDEKSLEGTECIMTIKHTDGKGIHEGKTFANVTTVAAPDSKKKSIK